MSRASILAKAIGADGILNVGDVAGLAAIASSGSATDLTTGTIPVARVGDASVTLAKLSATGTKDATTFLRGDNSFAVVSVTPTAVSDQNNSSTGAFDVPSGTTAQRPASPSVGMIRYNTDLLAIENYTSTGWFKISVSTPTVTSVSGSILSTIAGTLTLTGTNFGSGNATVRFISGGVTTDVTNVTPVSITSISVSVPSAVYNLSVSSSVDIYVLNSDNAISSPAQTVTVSGVPSGGTITTTGSYRVHTFTASGNLVVPSGFSRSAQYLIIAGGGGGAASSGGGAGGGGAGGYRSSVSGESSGGGASAESAITLTAQTYSVVVGGGAAAVSTGTGATGSNSSFGSLISFGGGGGANNAAPTAGGCGGGGGEFSGNNAGGAGTSGQGYAGGIGIFTPVNGGGGGGGAGSTGVTPTSGAAAIGGIGVQSSINGTATYRAGGGGASQNGIVGGVGGNGGGGNGGAGSGGSGTPSSGGANTGGGGGGIYNVGIGTINGGSGIVIIRYIL